MVTRRSSLRRLVGLFPVVGFAQATATNCMAQDLDPILKQFLDWSQIPKEAKKGAKQRRLEHSVKAKPQEPDEGVSISQGAYESKIAELIGYMRGGAINDTTNSVRREAAQIA